MNTLKSNGYRFMVSPTGREADWIHPAEISVRVPDWTDCTNMEDGEFDAFMAERRALFPPIAA